MPLSIPVKLFVVNMFHGPNTEFERDNANEDRNGDGTLVQYNKEHLVPESISMFSYFI